MNCIVEAWENHEIELRRFMLGKLQDPNLAEDLLQDTFIKAIAKGKGFCEIEQPRAWLFKVARNNMVDFLRRNPQMQELDENLAREQIELAGIASLSQCLPKALSVLSPEDQRAITYCDLEGMTQTDYAKQAGLSVAGAKSRIQRARQRLQQELKTACGVRYDEAGNVCCYDTGKCSDGI